MVEIIVACFVFVSLALMSHVALAHKEIPRHENSYKDQETGEESRAESRACKATKETPKGQEAARKIYQTQEVNTRAHRQPKNHGPED